SGTIRFIISPTPPSAADSWYSLCSIELVKDVFPEPEASATVIPSLTLPARKEGECVDHRLSPVEDRTLEQVVRDHAPRIYSLARRMLGNDADAQDVTQEVLLQLIRHLRSFRGEAAFPTWLHRVTVNAAL